MSDTAYQVHPLPLLTVARAIKALHEDEALEGNERRVIRWIDDMVETGALPVEDPVQTAKIMALRHALVVHVDQHTTSHLFVTFPKALCSHRAAHGAIRHITRLELSQCIRLFEDGAPIILNRWSWFICEQALQEFKTRNPERGTLAWKAE